MHLTMTRLLQPLTISQFQSDYYEKQPLLIKRQSPRLYEEVVTLDDINVHLGQAYLSSRGLRLVRDGKELGAEDFTYSPSSVNSHWASDTVNKDILFAKFYEGYTIILSEYERHSAAMLRLRHEVERFFHAPVISTLYLTPRNTQGFAPHWDRHDTLILQFTGTKEWRIYDSPISLPSAQQYYRSSDWTRVEPTLTAMLEPGDLLYVPRGFVHEARAQDSVSGHVTIGLYTNTYADLLRFIAANAHADAWMRKSLPADFHSVASSDEFLRHAHDFLDRADLPAYVERMHSDFAEERLSDATDRLNDYVRLPSVGMSSRLRMRSVVWPELANGGADVVLTFHGKSLTFPARAADSLRFMIGSDEFEVSALPGSGGENLALCTTLVREGFLSIA